MKYRVCLHVTRRECSQLPAAYLQTNIYHVYLHVTRECSQLPAAYLQTTIYHVYLHVTTRECSQLPAAHLLTTITIISSQQNLSPLPTAHI